MRPEFDIAIEFFTKSLITKGFSENVRWLFRENIVVNKGEIGRYKLTLNPNLNTPNARAKSIYDQLKEGEREIFFYTFIKGGDVTYVTIAGDDYDFDIDEGDLKIEEWNLKFGFNGHFNLDSDHIEFVEEGWDELKEKETKDIGPFDYFYLAERFN
jgi:hypothetical protein